jgi:hypothetical protein
MASTDKDVNHRIALAWGAFNKLYGCETWVLTTQQGKKIDVYPRTCYRIMLGLRQSETHTTNEELYRLAGARPITTIIRERQLQFTEHCLRLNKDEPANIYALYT